MAKEEQLEKEVHEIWNRLLFQFRLGNTLKLVLIFSTAVLIMMTMSKLLALSPILLFVLLVVVLGVLFLFNKQLLDFSELRLIDELNNRFGWLEYSAQLIPSFPKNLMQLLQRERILKLLKSRHKGIKVSPDLKKEIFFFLAILIPFSLTFFKNIEEEKINELELKSLKIAQVPSIDIEELPAIKSMQIDVVPPRYTGISLWNSEKPSFEAPEGSKLKFNVELTDSVDSFQVIWDGKDTLTVDAEEVNNYNWVCRLNTSAFYQFQYNKNRKVFVSPVYTIQAIDDVAPVIVIESPAPSTFILYGQQPKVDVKGRILDDYGINKAQIIATVSRGSGESVKFREKKLNFTEKTSGKKQMNLSRQIHFSELQMEPGDELYFHIIASDYADPSQISRSETYFVQWEDTTATTTAIMDGIAVDNMPAYFRSQRQIIIDTERLIKEQDSISKEEFKNRSNDLGIDQKVLRLRYGKFLGEEFETTIVRQSPDVDEKDHGKEEHVHDEEGHDHASEEKEHDAALEQLHDHDHQESRSTVFGSSEGMMEQYEHRHDVAEAATFFEEATKAQLKAALAQMWEAELRLRTLSPKEALSFEYKALELIKAVQQKSRVYVQRVGFEPPPLKPEEKRLTGELDEITNPRRTWEVKEEENVYPDLKKSVAVLEVLHQNPESNLSLQDKKILEGANQEAAVLFLEQPGISPDILKNFQKILSGEKINKVVIKDLQKQILKILPKENEHIVSGKGFDDPEFDRFLEILKD